MSNVIHLRLADLDHLSIFQQTNESNHTKWNAKPLMKRRVTCCITFNPILSAFFFLALTLALRGCFFFFLSFFRCFDSIMRRGEISDSINGFLLCLSWPNRLGGIDFHLLQWVLPWSEYTKLDKAWVEGRWRILKSTLRELFCGSPTDDNQVDKFAYL